MRWMQSIIVSFGCSDSSNVRIQDGVRYILVQEKIEKKIHIKSIRSLLTWVVCSNPEMRCWRQRSNMLLSVLTQIPDYYRIPDLHLSWRVERHDSFQAARKVCDLLSEGMAAMFGPQSNEGSAAVQSTCDVLEVPHIETRWDYRTRGTTTPSTSSPTPRLWAGRTWTSSRQKTGRSSPSSHSPTRTAEGSFHPPKASRSSPVPSTPRIPEAPQRVGQSWHQEHSDRRAHEKCPNCS
ncbi:glutamate receptor, ionotropic kainate 1 [Caerostris extrusa]|uniref:Glutamate receptor, ionotropic kainate 1 n=1 Tax=Caerostris extrusa TaxID=172846 RepID=A0AAV4SJX4_CAEEX|nr:glutamate receptor, ionotropic kainate 1 [Caerostris extrusa]